MVIEEVKQRILRTPALKTHWLQRGYDEGILLSKKREMYENNQLLGGTVRSIVRSICAPSGLTCYLIHDASARSSNGYACSQNSVTLID
jgi:hypothetical protein